MQWAGAWRYTGKPGLYQLYFFRLFQTLKCPKRYLCLALAVTSSGRIQVPFQRPFQWMLALNLPDQHLQRVVGNVPSRPVVFVFVPVSTRSGPRQFNLTLRIDFTDYTRLRHCDCLACHQASEPIMDKTTAGSRSRDGRQVIIRPVTATTSAGTVVARIESILEDILDCLAEGRELSIDFVVSRSGHSPQKVHFPGRNALEATKFGTRHCSSELCLRSASYLCLVNPLKPGSCSSCSSPTTPWSLEQS